MAQHDFSIANQGFPAFRSDLNDALESLVTNSSGATEPSTTYAHQFWVDTAANPSVLKQRNADNDAWITIANIDQTGDKFILVNPEYTGTLTGGTGVVNIGSGQVYKDASGNVGIGTSSPSGKLDVNGLGRFTVNADGVSTPLKLINNSATGTVIAKLAFENSGSVKASINAAVYNNDFLTFNTGSDTERMRIDASGNVGIGTSSPRVKLDARSDAVIASPTPLANAVDSGVLAIGDSVGSVFGLQLNGGSYDTYVQARNMGAGSTAYNLLLQPLGGNVGIGTSSPAYKMEVVGTIAANDGAGRVTRIIPSGTASTYSINSDTGQHIFVSGSNERMRIDSSGNLLVGKTAASTGNNGFEVRSNGFTALTVDGEPFHVERTGSDGILVRFRQDGLTEGNISVSGTTVSYNGGHLSRWAQLTTAKDDTLVKGTVLSNLDEMNVYTDAEGNPVENEQLNKVKVSDVEGDANVAGVFVNWDYDEDHNVDEINMAMTGDMIIRIAAGTTVARGDLLMSAGDGTAKPQGDDIVRAKTIAKVTSTNVTCTYEDGSYCVPCVLMAC